MDVEDKDFPATYVFIENIVNSILERPIRHPIKCDNDKSNMDLIGFVSMYLQSMYKKSEFYDKVEILKFHTYLNTNEGKDAMALLSSVVLDGIRSGIINYINQCNNPPKAIEGGLLLGKTSHKKEKEPTVKIGIDDIFSYASEGDNTKDTLIFENSAIKKCRADMLSDVYKAVLSEITQYNAKRKG